MSDINEKIKEEQNTPIENNNIIIQESPKVTESAENSKELTDNDFPSQKHAFLSSFIDYVEVFVSAICVVLVIFSVLFRTCTVDGGSMNYTLINGEVLIVSDFLYTPERGDVIVFHQTGTKNMPLVKRVIGLGGETVTIDFSSWTVSITDKNGQTTVLDEPYAKTDGQRNYQGIHEYVVPEGCLFVLGDNRNASMDSTDLYNVGFVDSRRVIGRVIIRILPIPKIGPID